MAILLEHMPEHYARASVGQKCLSNAYVRNVRTNEECGCVSSYLTLGNARRGAER